MASSKFLACGLPVPLQVGFAGTSCGVVVGQFLCAIECGLGHQIPEASFERDTRAQVC
jgi:hypothetical protein